MKSQDWKTSQWLIFPDEKINLFSNANNKLPGDASYLVQQVNSGEIENRGKTDWRLPTNDELRFLYGTSLELDVGWLWSSTPCTGHEKDFALAVLFGIGTAYAVPRTEKRMVRLFRDV